MTRYEILMGSTTNISIVFAEIELYRGSRTYFTVCFTEVAPFIATPEYLKERAESTIDSYGDCDKYDLCEKYDCKPSELVDYYMNEGIENIVDISLYPESFTIKGIDDSIYFESVAAGQHDTRKELQPIDPVFSEWLHEMWDQYHLKELSEEIESNAVTKIEEYIHNKIVDEDKWIQRWLETEVYQVD